MERKKAAETLMRCTCAQPSSAPQLLMSDDQNWKPERSGSRLRKSRYCWRTKKPVLKFESQRTGLGLLMASRGLLLMVSVAVEGEPSVVPTGFESVMLRVSGDSLKRSSGTKTSVPSVCS